MLWILLLTSCVGGSSRKDAAQPSTVDSQLLRPPFDPGQPIDTDDNNKPSSEDVTLDSPTGPNPGWDTVLTHPVPGRH
ncbi:hypothetical protein GCM10028786_26450 [Flaviaesturariibacter terrae]